jgi:hypothetical protein
VCVGGGGGVTTAVGSVLSRRAGREDAWNVCRCNEVLPITATEATVPVWRSDGCTSVTATHTATVAYVA